jgi:hypothetical protein
MRQWPWEMPMTSHSEPGGHDLRLELQRLDHRRDAPEHVHDERELVGRLQRAHVEQRLDARGVPAVEALELGLDPRLVHGGEHLEDLRVGVGEHHVEDELLLVLRVLRVVHRAHVEGADLGASP